MCTNGPEALLTRRGIHEHRDTRTDPLEKLQKGQCVMLIGVCCIFEGFDDEYILYVRVKLHHFDS